LEGSAMDKINLDASSSIASVGYDSETLTMEVEFTNGNIYQYFDVPQGVYEELITAESAGQFRASERRLSARKALMKWLTLSKSIPGSD
jgi:KTSC domain